MSIPVLDKQWALSVQSNGSEDAFARLQLVRRRLHHVLGDVENFRERCSDDEDWVKVSEAAWAATRALRAAINAIPAADLGVWDGTPAVELEGLRIDLEARRAWYGDQGLELTQLEFGLLVALAREPTRVYTKGELLRDVWDYRALGRTRTVDSHASRLRRKLIAGGAPEGQFVITLWGVGYSLVRP